MFLAIWDAISDVERRRVRPSTVETGCEISTMRVYIGSLCTDLPILAAYEGLRDDGCMP